MDKLMSLCELRKREGSPLNKPLTLKEKEVLKISNGSDYLLFFKQILPNASLFNDFYEKRASLLGVRTSGLRY